MSKEKEKLVKEITSFLKDPEQFNSVLLKVHPTYDNFYRINRTNGVGLTQDSYYMEITVGPDGVKIISSDPSVEFANKASEKKTETPRIACEEACLDHHCPCAN